MVSYPIDDILPELLETAERADCLVLQAPPGAGKTTRVPLALLDLPSLSHGTILMLEPRRLAAVNAARWMASTLDERPGETVGYATRFERRVSSSTRIEVVTEGILTRRLQSDPLLEGVSMVIFDEFHERSLNSDLGLALCRDVQTGLRPDLKLLVMSATLDGEKVAKLLGDAPLLTSSGRSYPVEVRYEEREPQERIAETASAGVMRALSETEGDVLVFLPGAGEIRRCERMLKERRPDISVFPLYADLPFEKQEEAIRPGARRKAVLATTIAETSLTIEGVRVVVDCGWSRKPRYDASSGLNRLSLVRVSAAAAEQRTGRAGRTAPGVCYRLWTRHTQSFLIPFDPPEILSADLSSLALELALWGIADSSALSWLDTPPAAALTEGKRLLHSLGALDKAGRITALGKKLSAYPAHPRLARILHDASAGRFAAAACDCAALLTERDIFREGGFLRQERACESDLWLRLEALDAVRRGASAPEADRSACTAVERTADYWRRRLRIDGKGPLPTPHELGELIAPAYPDRIARVREPGSERYLLSGGKGGKLSPRSCVRDAEFIVATVMEGGGGGDALIHGASAISLEAIRRIFAEQIEERRSVSWNAVDGRVTALEGEFLDQLPLVTRPVKPAQEELSAALLDGIAAGPGLAALTWSDAARQMQARALFLRRLFPDDGWPDLSDEALTASLREWLTPWVSGMRSLEQVGKVDVAAALKALLPWDLQRRLDDLAPTHITVPSGSRIALDYSADGPPVLAVKLQELFGLAETPSVAGGRVPVLLHLLSPARRPIQVTSDLKGFWNGAYFEVKKELKGRYPKHPWPDDPWNAVATRHTKRRSEGK